MRHLKLKQGVCGMATHTREQGFPIKREPTFITNALSLETRRLANVLAIFTDCLM